jgi:hypothetical protein
VVLAIPHFVILVFLWIAMLASTVVALFAILFTGRYPRALFDFSVGVFAGPGGSASTPTTHWGPTGSHLSRFGTCRTAC